jgi:hypothetical protein
MFGPSGVPGSPFALLAHVDDASATILPLTRFGDGAFANARLGVVDERQESFGMFHLHLL